VTAPSNQRLKLAARRLGNASFSSAPQLKRASLGGRSETMEQTEAIKRTEAFLHDQLGLEARFGPGGPEWSQLSLPSAPGAQYNFEIHVYTDGEPQICARLLNDDANRYFWYHPFEVPDFGSVEERDKGFFEALELLVTRPSRIRQSKGLFLCRFVCEVLDSEQWRRVGPSMSALTLTNFRFPPGRNRTYTAPPSLTGGATGPAA
jgi:hypothetical protein